MEDLKRILHSLPFFEGFSEEHFELLVGCARNERASSGTFLFREGEEATKFYLLREGQVSVEIHSPGLGPLTVQTVSENEPLGWSWLFAPYTWHFDARVTEETRLVSFDGRCLRTKCENDPAFGYQLLKRLSSIMTQRIEALSFQLMDVYGDHG
jgi:CRP/FNR family transcriptional regulator, cyclic AMP receptor protein